MRTSDTAPGDRSNRLTYLDSLRGLGAVLIALFWHYQHFAPKPWPNGNVADRLPGFFSVVPFAILYRYGEYAVDFFFVLSGLIFAHVYWDTIRERRISARDFAALRFARLYPIHFAGLIVTGVLAWTYHAATGRFPIYDSNGVKAFVANVFMAQYGIFPLDYSFDGPSWSLSIEAMLYALFFVVAHRGLRVSAPIVMMLSGLAIFASPSRNFWFLVNEPVARGLMGFALGIMLSRVVLNGSHAWAAFAGLAAYAAIVRIAAQHFAHPEFRYLLADAFAAMSIIAVLRSRLLRRILDAPPLVLLGEMSLSIYLVHVPIQIAFMLGAVAFGIRIPYVSSLFWISYACAVLSAAGVTHYAYERPARRYFRALLSTRSMGAVRPAVAPAAPLSSVPQSPSRGVIP